MQLHVFLPGGRTKAGKAKALLSTGKARAGKRFIAHLCDQAFAGLNASQTAADIGRFVIKRSISHPGGLQNILMYSVLKTQV